MSLLFHIRYINLFLFPFLHIFLMCFTYLTNIIDKEWYWDRKLMSFDVMHDDTRIRRNLLRGILRIHVIMLFDSSSSTYDTRKGMYSHRVIYTKVKIPTVFPLKRRSTLQWRTRTKCHLPHHNIPSDDIVTVQQAVRYSNVRWMHRRFTRCTVTVPSLKPLDIVWMSLRTVLNVSSHVRAWCPTSASRTVQLRSTTTTRSLSLAKFLSKCRTIRLVIIPSDA